MQEFKHIYKAPTHIEAHTYILQWTGTYGNNSRLMLSFVMYASYNRNLPCFVRPLSWN